MRELSEELLVDKAHTTRAVRELESRGLAICKEDEKDKRIKRLHLTPRGKSIAQQAENTMNEWSNALFKGLSEEELKTLGDILKKAYDNTHELIESIKRD
ncbi:MAG: hypothetical protein EOM87_07685 [Clostridia bacterium]|nr:hypothetical protein [Clostridia bacterium]